MLAPLEERTRPLTSAARAALADAKGADALEPWNLSYALSGAPARAVCSVCKCCFACARTLLLVVRHAARRGGLRARGAALGLCWSQAGVLGGYLWRCIALYHAEKQHPLRQGQAGDWPRLQLHPSARAVCPAGDVEREMDAYFPFEAAVDAWARCFAALAIHYRGATMRLDLCDRPGKYSNGFCHWPQPAWRHPDGAWVPSAANFTSLATPSAIGSGRTALVTLLHEGGHAVRGPTPPCSGALLACAPCHRVAARASPVRAASAAAAAVAMRAAACCVTGWLCVAWHNRALPDARRNPSARAVDRAA